MSSRLSCRQPQYRKGTVVAALTSRGHPPEVYVGKEMLIVERRSGPFYAVLMDGKYHRWFAEFELERVRRGK